MHLSLSGWQTGEDDTRSGDVTYSDPPTFEELSTGENAFHLRIIRGVSAWWDELDSTSSDGFDPLFYRIKLIGEPVFNWMSDWENDTRASGTPANPTFDQLTTGENVVYKRVIRGVTTWWDALPAVTAASGFDLPFAYLKEWFSAGSDLGAWLFTNVVTPIQTWWNATEKVGGTDAENTFPARVWRGIIDLGDAFADDVLEGLGDVWDFFDEHVITPVTEWWEATEDTTTGADNTIPARVWRGIIDLVPFGNDIVTEVTDGLDWAFDTVTETWDYIRGNVTDFGANILEGFGSAWAYFNSNIVTPIQTWWETTADTETPADDSIPARVWRGILDLGSAFTDGISDGVSDALDTAIEGLTFVDGTIRDWINDNLNVVAVRAGLLTLGTWLGAGASVIGKVVTDLPGQLYTGATTFTHVVRGILFGGINTTAAGWLEDRGTEIQAALGTTYSRLVTFGAGITTSASAWLQARGADIQTALGDAWVNVNNLVTEIGSDAADWLEEQSAEIVTALGAAGNTAWTWLQALPGSARNFLTGITSTIHSTLDRIAGWVGTASTALAWISDTLYDGATTFVDAAKEALFGGGTPEAFAESEADGQITSALSSGGDITAKIGTEIKSAWDDFWEGLDDVSYSANMTLTQILEGITDFFTSGSTTTDDTKATKALDNLSSVSINKPLKFASVLNTPTPNYSLWRVGSNMEIRTVSTGDFNVRLGDDILFKVGTPTTTELPVVPLIVEDDGVRVNEPLVIGVNTNPGLNIRGIGADSLGYLYFKTPSVNGHWYFQNNGGSNRTEFEILKQAIKIGEDNNSASDPTGNGEIKRVGTTLKAYVGGEVKDFADIGGGSGSGANAELSNLTDPTELNQGLSFEGGADTRVDGGAAGVGADTGNDLYINVPNTFDRVRFSANGTSYTEISRYGLKLPSFPTTTEVALGGTLVPGTIWYNSTTGTIRGVVADDTIIDLSGGGSGGDSYTAATMEDFIDGLTTESAPSTGDYLMLDVGSEVRKVTLEDIGVLIGGSGGDLSAVAQDIIPNGNSYVLGSTSNRWDSLTVRNIFATGDISCRDLEPTGIIEHTGNQVGFFDTGTAYQETWNDNVTSLASAATRKAKTNDTASNLAGIINAILDRLEDIGLIEY